MSRTRACWDTAVLVIGGGVTGTGVVRDLALRGVECILVDKQDINAGASGANHGLLHSGARYVVSDPQAARACQQEGAYLKKLAGHCVEATGGLFVAVPGDDENYIADFAQHCAACGIQAQPLSVEQARLLEPTLASNIIAAYHVPDGALDPFRLALANLAQAQAHGCRYLKNTQVVGFEQRQGQIEVTLVRDVYSGQVARIRSDQVVNATGAWASQVAALAGIEIQLAPSKGTLLVTPWRLTRHVINRLRPPTNGDILVPAGTVSVLGTSSVRVANPDQARPTVTEVEEIIDQGAAMIPLLGRIRYIRAFAGVRPLLYSSAAKDDREISRGFALLDHGPQGVRNLVTITGGKLTTYRLMAEKTADLVCQRLGVSAPCLTRTTVLPVSPQDQWTPGERAPQVWLQKGPSQSMLLCECELVGKEIIDQLHDQMRQDQLRPDLRAMAQRSRIGKGPCQGTFCSQRIMAYLYRSGKLDTDQGVAQLQDFLRERWRGQRPLLWDAPLAQAELLEAVHCGLLGLELEP